MAISPVQDAVATSTVDVNSLAVTFASTPTIGNTIIVCVGVTRFFGTADIGTNGVTDNKGNTYTRDVISSTHPDGFVVAIFSAPVTSSSATFTVTVNGVNSDDGLWFTASEFAGLGAFDTFALAAGGSGTHASGALNATTAQADELEIAVDIISSNGTTQVIDSVSPAYTSIGNDSAAAVNGTLSSTPRGDVSYRILTATTTVGASWGPQSTDFRIAVATYRASGGGGGGSPIGYIYDEHLHVRSWWAGEATIYGWFDDDFIAPAGGSGDISTFAGIRVGVHARSVVSPEPVASARATVGAHLPAGAARPEPTAATAVRVGVHTRTSPTVDVSTSALAEVGVLAVSLPAADNDVTVGSIAEIGVHLRSSPSVDVSVGARAQAGVGALAGARPEPAATTAGHVGVQARSTVTPEPSAVASARVGIHARSTVTPEPATATTAHVGVHTRTSPTVDITAGALAHVGIHNRSTPTIDVTTGALAEVGIYALSLPQADTDIIVGSLAHVGVHLRSTVTPEPSIAARTTIGVHTRSAPSVEVVAAALTALGVHTRTPAPSITVTATAVTHLGVHARSAPTITITTSTGTTYVGVVVAATPTITITVGTRTVTGIWAYVTLGAENAPGTACLIWIADTVTLDWSAPTASITWTAPTATIEWSEDC